MMNKDTRLIDLTAGEFVDLITSTIKENEKIAIVELPPALTTEKLSLLTGLAKSTIHIKNHNREIPGCRKVGGRLLFDTKEILEWIESGKVPTAEESIQNLENNFNKIHKNKK